MRSILNIDKYWIIVMQVLLVTGGYNGIDKILASTEVMEAGGTWRFAASLPSARDGLRAAVVNNNIFVFGENILCYILILNISLYLIMFIMTMTIYICRRIGRTSIISE